MNDETRKDSHHMQPEIKFESNGFCSFCLRRSDETDRLMQANGLPICNDCVKECYRILVEKYPSNLNLPNGGWITK